MEELRDPNVLFMNPFLALDNADALKVRLYDELSKHFDVTKEEIDHVVFNIFCIRCYDRAVVMVVGTFHLIFLIRNTRIENGVDTLL